MSDLIVKNTMHEYLSSSQYIDWTNAIIQEKANEFQFQSENEIEIIRSVYEYVRDEIKHSWDVQDRRVTICASDVMKEKVGICWAKANLLAALLRACGIPTGICYQRLTLGDSPEAGFCIHALNATYVKSINKWIRLDARGNKDGVEAQMNLEYEQLAFQIREDIGEIDYKIVYAEPSHELMSVLEQNDDMLDVYLHSLPDRIDL